MRRSTFLFAFLSFIFLAACGPGNSREQNTEEAPPDPAVSEVQPTALPMSGEQYTITVLDREPASPRKEMSGTVSGAQIKVNYGSPSVKGREIWGGLEAWDKVWRAGANEATTVTFTQDVMVEGQPLLAGTYAFFVIPRENDWTVIFNNTHEQWGAYSYDEGQDALRATVTPQMLDSDQETLEYYVDGDALVLRWEKVALPVKITAKQQ